MRTTVTLDPDTQALIQAMMRDRGLTFKQALNLAIRSGFSTPAQSDPPFATPTFAMGRPRVDLDKALRLAGDLEDAELTRELAARR
jgi:hypothetical protein